jgi:hypothetical protein
MNTQVSRYATFAGSNIFSGIVGSHFFCIFFSKDKGKSKHHSIAWLAWNSKLNLKNTIMVLTFS